VTVHEIKELKEAFQWVEVLDIERELFRPQFGQCALKGRDVEGLVLRDLLLLIVGQCVSKTD
jgi:hypothetical protein